METRNRLHVELSKTEESPSPAKIKALNDHKFEILKKVDAIVTVIREDCAHQDDWQRIQGILNELESRADFNAVVLESSHLRPFLAQLKLSVTTQV